MDPFDDIVDKALGKFRENVEKNAEAVQLYTFYSTMANHMKIGIKAFEDVGFSYDAAYEMVSNIILLNIENGLNK